MIKVGKKTDIFIGQPLLLFYFFTFAVVEVCSGCLVMVKIMWLSRDVMVAKETAVILYQSNNALIG